MEVFRFIEINFDKSLTRKVQNWGKIFVRFIESVRFMVCPSQRDSTVLLGAFLPLERFGLLQRMILTNEYHLPIPIFPAINQRYLMVIMFAVTFIFGFWFCLERALGYTKKKVLKQSNVRMLIDFFGISRLESDHDHRLVFIL